MSGRRSKAERRRRAAERERQLTQAVAELAKHVERLSCSSGVADDCDERCHERLGDLEFDVDLTTAILELWRRTNSTHPIVAPLEALVVEYERHRSAIEEIRHRFAPYWGKDASHDHVEPTREDLSRIGNAIMGDDMPDLPE
jgi:hypothetical protein